MYFCSRRFQIDRARRSASSRQCACPFYSSHGFCFSKASHHSSLSVPPQPTFGSLRLLAFRKVKIALEREEICECDGHTVHKLSQRRLTVDWLASRESDCLRTHSKVSSYKLPSYIKATRPVLEIFKMDGYLPDSPRTWEDFALYVYIATSVWVRNVLEDVCGLCWRRESLQPETRTLSYYIQRLWYPAIKGVTEEEHPAVREKTNSPCAVLFNTHSISDVTDKTRFTSSRNWHWS